MTDLTTSIKHLASLNRAPGSTWTDATKRKIPHKNTIMKDEL
jgi:putative restriction endonuclease